MSGKLFDVPNILLGFSIGVGVTNLIWYLLRGVG